MSVTYELLREIFVYRDDGRLVWKRRLGGRTKTGDVAGYQREDGYYQIRIFGQGQSAKGGTGK